MAVYVVIHLGITDRHIYEKYCRAAPPIIQKYGGRYLANTEEITILAGDWQPQKTVLLEFENLKKIRDCFRSAEYRAIAPMREKSTVSNAFIINGTTHKG
jgi:uncharacterized protein (DUF1330 family)